MVLGSLTALGSGDTDGFGVAVLGSGDTDGFRVAALGSGDTDGFRVADGFGVRDH